MPTIQIRDIPEDAYETLRRRAQAEGRSIQAYMLQRVVEMTRAPTKAEALELIERSLAEHGGADITFQQIAAEVTADRR